MEWDDKLKMIQLGKKIEESNEAKKEFQKFVLEHIDSFDGQAWDMFCNLVNFTVDGMREDFEFWKDVYQRIKDVDCNDQAFGLRSGLRIALIQAICKDELKM